MKDRKKAIIALIVCLALCCVSMLGGAFFQSDFGSAKVKTRTMSLLEIAEEIEANNAKTGKDVECSFYGDENLNLSFLQMIPKNAYEFKRDVKPRKKKTLQFTKDNQFLAEYESTAEAERQTGVKQHGIQNCARGEIRSYGGFIWRYA